jgi:hypothetical protein
LSGSRSRFVADCPEWVGGNLDDWCSKAGLDGGNVGREFAPDHSLGEFGSVSLETADGVGWVISPPLALALFRGDNVTFEIGDLVNRLLFCSILISF